MPSRLAKSLPWTSSPLIINAPMGGFAGADLAVAVTNSGGLGQIGAINDAKWLEQQLESASRSLREESQKTLPIGVGLLTFLLKFDDVLPILSKHSPAVIWLFAGNSFEEYAGWTDKVRQSCPHSEVWIQVGSVAGALQIAKDCKPDAVILQGIDAGGHGFEKGAGIISLLPEAKDALAKNGFDIPLLASGGIVDGRGVAAALSLGADGVVLGTRFLSAKETIVHPKYQEALIKTSDGGQHTVRAKVFDELRGPNPWPQAYDGRSLITKSYTDRAGGVALEEVQNRHTEALKEKDLGFGESNRATMWAGTGVGLVTKVQGAAEIVQEVREGTKTAMEAARAKL